MDDAKRITPERMLAAQAKVGARLVKNGFVAVEASGGRRETCYCAIAIVLKANGKLPESLHRKAIARALKVGVTYVDGFIAGFDGFNSLVTGDLAKLGYADGAACSPSADEAGVMFAPAA